MAERMIRISEKEEVPLVGVIGALGTWNVGKNKIISYNSCKKLFAKAKLTYTDAPTLVCQPNDSNKQQHIWLMGMKDYKGDVVYSDGEASKYNTGKITNITKDGKTTQGYVELTEIDAKYRSRMAFKRAFCRCVLDILGLEEYYSDSDSSSFENNTKSGDEITSETIDSL